MITDDILKKLTHYVSNDNTSLEIALADLTNVLEKTANLKQIWENCFTDNVNTQNKLLQFLYLCQVICQLKTLLPANHAIITAHNRIIEICAQFIQQVNTTLAPAEKIDTTRFIDELSEIEVTDNIDLFLDSRNTFEEFIKHINSLFENEPKKSPYKKNTPVKWSNIYKLTTDTATTLAEALPQLTVFATHKQALITLQSSPGFISSQDAKKSFWKLLHICQIFLYLPNTLDKNHSLDNTHAAILEFFIKLIALIADTKINFFIFTKEFRQTEDILQLSGLQNLTTITQNIKSTHSCAFELFPIAKIFNPHDLITLLQAIKYDRTIPSENIFLFNRYFHLLEKDLQIAALYNLNTKIKLALYNFLSNPELKKPQIMQELSLLDPFDYCIDTIKLLSAKTSKKTTILHESLLDSLRNTTDAILQNENRYERAFIKAICRFLLSMQPYTPKVLLTLIQIYQHIYNKFENLDREVHHAISSHTHLLTLEAKLLFLYFDFQRQQENISHYTASGTNVNWHFFSLDSSQKKVITNKTPSTENLKTLEGIFFTIQEFLTTEINFCSDMQQLAQGLEETTITIPDKEDLALHLKILGHYLFDEAEVIAQNLTKTTFDLNTLNNFITTLITLFRSANFSVRINSYIYIRDNYPFIKLWMNNHRMQIEAEEKRFSREHSRENGSVFYLPLDALLIKPTQRMVQYELLSRSFLKEIQDYFSSAIPEELEKLLNNLIAVTKAIAIGADSLDQTVSSKLLAAKSSPFFNKELPIPFDEIHQAFAPDNHEDMNQTNTVFKK